MPLLTYLLAIATAIRDLLDDAVTWIVQTLSEVPSAAWVVVALLGVLIAIAGFRTKVQS